MSKADKYTPGDTPEDYLEEKLTQIKNEYPGNKNEKLMAQFYLLKKIIDGAQTRQDSEGKKLEAESPEYVNKIKLIASSRHNILLDSLLPIFSDDHKGIIEAIDKLKLGQYHQKEKLKIFNGRPFERYIILKKIREDMERKINKDNKNNNTKKTISHKENFAFLNLVEDKLDINRNKYIEIQKYVNEHIEKRW